MGTASSGTGRVIFKAIFLIFVIQYQQLRAEFGVGESQGGAADLATGIQGQQGTNAQVNQQWDGYLGEAKRVDPTAGDTTDYSNGISAGIAGNHLLGADAVKDDPMLNKLGREHKANEAAGNGLAGGIVATSLGGTFMGIGVPMLYSPILPVQLAGADLIAKGAQELAQGITNIATAGNNNNQEQVLINDAAQKARQEVDFSKLAQQMKTPELDKVLNERGINPQSFKEKAITGQLNSPAEALKALGVNTPVTDKDIAEAMKISESQSGEIFAGSMNKKDSTATLISDESKEKEMGVSTGIRTAVESSGAKAAGPPSGGSNLGGSSLLSILQGQAVAGGEAKGKEAAVFDAQGMLAGFLKNGLGLSPADAILRDKLLRAGISWGTGVANIFHLAHRKYRSFGKWRKKSFQVVSVNVPR